MKRKMTKQTTISWLEALKSTPSAAHRAAATRGSAGVMAPSSRDRRRAERRRNRLEERRVAEWD